MKFKILSTLLIIAQILVYVNVYKTSHFLVESELPWISILYFCIVYFAYAVISSLLSLVALFFEKSKRTLCILINSILSLTLFYGTFYLIIDDTFVRTLPVLIPECICLLLLSVSLYREQINKCHD